MLHILKKTDVLVFPVCGKMADNKDKLSKYVT